MHFTNSVQVLMSIDIDFPFQIEAEVLPELRENKSIFLPNKIANGIFLCYEKL